MVAEGDLRRGEPFGTIQQERLELAEKHLQARATDRRQIHGEVDHGPITQTADLDPDQRPLIGARHALFQAGPHGREHVIIGAGCDVLGHVPRLDVRQDQLVTVAVDDRAQHVMAFDQPTPCLGDPLSGHQSAVLRRVVGQLEVGVARDVAVIERITATQQIGALHVGEGKGSKRSSRRECRLDGVVGRVTQMGQERLLAALQPLLLLIVHRSGRCSEAQPPPSAQSTMPAASKSDRVVRRLIVAVLPASARSVSGASINRNENHAH